MPLTPPSQGPSPYRRPSRPAGSGWLFFGRPGPLSDPSPRAGGLCVCTDKFIPILTPLGPCIPVASMRIPPAWLQAGARASESALAHPAAAAASATVTVTVTVTVNLNSRWHERDAMPPADDAAIPGPADRLRFESRSEQVGAHGA